MLPAKMGARGEIDQNPGPRSSTIVPQITRQNVCEALVADVSRLQE